MEKTQARKAALAQRDQTAAAQISEWSDVIAERFLSEFSSKKSFLLYHSKTGEVQTHGLVDFLYGMKKIVYLPKVNGDRLLTGLYKGEDSLSYGAFGILEPVECADFDYIDIAVVPGVAFDKRLNRTGYGKGYYDRLLGAAHYGLSVGFAFEFQVFETLDTEPHDMPVDVLVTENNIYRRNS